MKSPDLAARNAIVVLAPLPVTRGDVAFWSGKTMSCSAPSPLIRVSWTTCPSMAVRTGLTLPSIVAADADIDHPSFRDPGTQGVSRVGHVGDCRRRLRACGGAGCSVVPPQPAKAAALRSGGLCAACGCREIGDHVRSVVVRLEAWERHLVARHDLRGILRYWSSV